MSSPSGTSWTGVESAIALAAASSSGVLRSRNWTLADDPDGAARGVVLGLPGAVLQATVDGDVAALLEVFGGWLGALAVDGDVEEAGVVLGVPGLVDAEAELGDLGAAG
jgi:hypothetical protein